jgi:hypothetical protein
LNLFCNRFLILLPLFLELFKLVINLTNFHLEYS